MEQKISSKLKIGGCGTIECTLKTYVEAYFCKLNEDCKLLQDITRIKSATGGNGCCT